MPPIRFLQPNGSRRVVRRRFSPYLKFQGGCDGPDPWNDGVWNGQFPADRSSEPGGRVRSINRDRRVRIFARRSRVIRDRRVSGRVERFLEL